MQAGSKTLDGQLNVLLIEDDSEDVLLIRRALERGSFADVSVTHVHELAAGMEALQNHPACYDVVLLDLTLPDSGGLEGVELLVPFADGVPIIVITGIEDDDLSLAAMRCGAHSLLPKQALFGKGLLREVTHALERARLSGELTQRYEEIRSAERRFRRMLEVNSDAILVVKANRDVVFANDAASRLLGIPLDQLIGGQLALDLDQNEVEFPRPETNESAWGDLTAVDTYWQGHEVRLVSIRDVTFRRQAEAQLRAHHERLQELVAERTRDLRRAVKELELQNQEKRDFVSNASHELKTPLTSISFGIDNLLDGDFTKALPTAAKDYLALIRQDCARLRRTLDDILDVSRIDAQALVLNHSIVHFGRLCRESIVGLEALADEKDVRLRSDLTQAVGFVRCDPVKIGRCITNILQNAIKFTPAGGFVEVSGVCARRAGDPAELRVVDSGPGIAPENMDLVTRRYFRAAESVEGTGLGLAIAKEIVELHGGALELQSPPPGRSQGTQAAIRLCTAASPVVATVHGDGVNAAVLDNLRRGGFEMSLIRPDRDDNPHAETSLVLVALSASDYSALTVVSGLRARDATARMPIMAVVEPGLTSGAREALVGMRVETVCSSVGPDGIVAAIDALLVNKARIS